MNQSILKFHNGNDVIDAPNVTIVSKTKDLLFEDKYFDFVYETDFIKIIKYYFDNVVNCEKLEKTINICI